MIVQGLLDFLAGLGAGIVGLIPPLPDEAAVAVNAIDDGMGSIIGYVSVFGIVVPFDALAIVATAYVGVLAFWAAALIVRGIVWVIGR